MDIDSFLKSIDPSYGGSHLYVWGIGEFIFQNGNWDLLFPVKKTNFYLDI